MPRLPHLVQKGLAMNDNRRCFPWSAVVVLLSIAVAGCTKYPQVEFANLKYIAALRTACSAENQEWLAETKSAIERDHAAGIVSDDEAVAYGEIITIAESGDWKSAELECLRFQKDQLAE